VQEKVRKEKDTPVAAPLEEKHLKRCPALLANPERETNSPARIKITARARARTSSREVPRGRLRCSACSTGEEGQQPLCSEALGVLSVYRSQRMCRFELVAFVLGPRRASRAPQGKPRVFARRCSSPSARFFLLRAGEFGSRAACLRSAGHRAAFARRRDRGVLL